MPCQLPNGAISAISRTASSRNRASPKSPSTIRTRISLITTLKRLHRQSILLQLSIEGGSADPQKVRRYCTVALCIFKRTHDGPSFDFHQRKNGGNGLLEMGLDSSPVMRREYHFGRCTGGRCHGAQLVRGVQLSLMMFTFEAPL